MIRPLFKLTLSLLLALPCAMPAQRNIKPTDTIYVSGKINNRSAFSISAILQMTQSSIPDQVIYNHKGEAKDTLTGLKGIALKTLLHSIGLAYDKPKELNEFYFVLTASDGYRIVISWNELYNTEAGNHFFILTEAAGKNLQTMDQRIAFIATGDLKSGRRYVKCLKSIEVKKLD